MSADLGRYVGVHSAAGRLVVQPRMGMADPEAMAAGIAAVAGLDCPTVATVTIDSYTRVGDHSAAARALRSGASLNGFPIVSHGPHRTALVAAAAGEDVPVQVRHGSARPGAILAAAAEAGLGASEGGPVSYCLPYGRTPLVEAVSRWADATEMFGELRGRPRREGAPRNVRRVPARAAVPTVPADRHQRAGGAVLRAARPAQRLAELRAADPPGAGHRGARRARPVGDRAAAGRRRPAHRALHVHGRVPARGRRGSVAACRQRADRCPGRRPAAHREDRDRGAPHPHRGREPGGADRGRRLGGACPARHRSAGPGRGRLLAGPGRGPGPGARRAGALLRRGPGAGEGIRVRDARRPVLPAR